MAAALPQDALLAELRIRGPRSGPELERLLGISQPTFSRLVRSRGDVLVVGAARHTRYAARRELPGLESPLSVYEIGAASDRAPLVRLHPVYPRGFYVEPGALPHQGSPDLLGFYDDLPWFLDDLRPQGFLGRLIALQSRSLGLPRDVRDWSGDHVLSWLRHEGTDVPGSLVIGEAAARRVREGPLPPSSSGTAAEYARAAERVLTEGIPGSSAAGEQPKFLALREGRHVLVKFSPPLQDPVSERVGDLLRAEHLALRRVAAAGRRAATSRLIEGEGRVFLEVERFDRIGARERAGLVSMHTLDAEYVGRLVSWTDSARALHAQGRITASALADVRWLEQFGTFIGNTDRHAGNLAFVLTRGVIGGLAPIYDMLPMHFHPRAGTLVEQAMPLDVELDAAGAWRSARDAALAFWMDVAGFPTVTEGFRAVARACRARLERELPA